MKQIIEWVLSHYQEIAASGLTLYEVIVRLFPTVKNYSIINKVVRILSWLDVLLNNRKKV